MRDVTVPGKKEEKELALYSFYFFFLFLLFACSSRHGLCCHAHAIFDVHAFFLSRLSDATSSHAMRADQASTSTSKRARHSSQQDSAPRQHSSEDMSMDASEELFTDAQQQPPAAACGSGSGSGSGSRKRKRAAPPRYEDLVPQYSEYAEVGMFVKQFLQKAVPTRMWGSGANMRHIFAAVDRYLSRKK